MKRLAYFSIAGLLMAATIAVNIFDELNVAQHKAKEIMLSAFGSGNFSAGDEIVKKARSLPVEVRVEGARPKTSCFHYPQLRIIQHDLLFSIQFKLYRSNRIMCRTFHFHHFTKTKFLVFYFLTYL